MKLRLNLIILLSFFVVGGLHSAYWEGEREATEWRRDELLDMRSRFRKLKQDRFAAESRKDEFMKLRERLERVQFFNNAKGKLDKDKEEVLQDVDRRLDNANCEVSRTDFKVNELLSKIEQEERTQKKMAQERNDRFEQIKRPVKVQQGGGQANPIIANQEGDSAWKSAAGLVVFTGLILAAFWLGRESAVSSQR